MGLLQKLKSALGLDGERSPGSGTTGPRDASVTVEHEPSTESEEAVKGTDESTDPAAAESDSGAGTAEPAVEAEETTEAGSGDSATGEAEGDGSEDTEESPPVTEINGIGPAYGERLTDAGVETVADLAGADAADLAERTDLSETRISGWIEQAESF